MIEILQKYGFVKIGERCNSCPGPKGTKWKLGRFIVNEYPAIGTFTFRRSNYLVHRGAANELDEYLKKNITPTTA